MDKNFLLQKLPANVDQWVKISDDQSVPEIIEEIKASHESNRELYDRIALYFDGKSISQICENISDFEAENFEYREEGTDTQTAAVPQGILSRGYGDCKHFSSFAGGVLDAIERKTGRKINWCYRFASYRVLQRTPYHVFVVVFDRGNEIWIDETPGARGKSPVWIQDEKVKKEMGLYRQIAGADDLEVEAAADTEVPGVLVAPIGLLMSLGVIDAAGGFNEARFSFLNTFLPAERKSQMLAALQVLAQSEGATVGNFFSDAFKGVQHFAAGMGMQVPRASFLILVKMNAFGYANKLAKALEYDDTRNKLADLWWRVGGTPSALETAIRHGETQPPATTVSSGDAQKEKLTQLAQAGGTYTDANGYKHDINTGAVILGVGDGSINGAMGSAAIGIVPVVAGAIISSAAIIVAAVMPVISKLLEKKTSNIPGLPVDPVTGLPVGYGASNSFISFVQSNPIIVAGAVVALYYAYENYG